MGFTYLASPFEHKNPDVMEARCESVRLITSSLVAKGDVVFSPIAYTENSELPEPPQGWLKFDLAMLQCADLLLIACMPGHQDSAGIKQEIEFAKKHDIKINRHSGDENAMGPKRIITAYTIRKRKRSRSE